MKPRRKIKFVVSRYQYCSKCGGIIGVSGGCNCPSWAKQKKGEQKCNWNLSVPRAKGL